MYGSASINFVFNFAIKEALRYNFFFQISLMTVMFKEKSTVHFLCIRVCKKKKYTALLTLMRSLYENTNDSLEFLR